MAAKTRSHSGTQSFDSLMDFEDHELQQTLDDFLEDEKKENSNIWNFATIAGIAMVFVGMFSMVQILGLNIGPDLSGLVTLLPFIGGILVTLVGFGFFVGDRKKEKKARKKQKEKQEQRSYRYDFESDDAEKGGFTLNNDLGNKDSKKHYAGDKYQFDRYAYREQKKLYKSRDNKKISGVCSGLAKYFGISTTVVRLLFVVTFFAGSGTSLLLYIALAFALDKEPTESQKRYRYDF